MSGYEKVTEYESLVANEDLSSNKWRFVVRDATTFKARRPDSATEYPMGVLYSKPTSGEEAKVATSGLVKVVAGSALTVNTLVCAEYNSAADAGKAIAASSQSDVIMGIVVVAAAAEDDLAVIRLWPSFSAAGTVCNATAAINAVTEATHYATALAVTEALTITDIDYSIHTVPVSSGTVTLDFYNYDLSGTADDTIGTQVDLESATAKNGAAATVTTTAADLVCAAGDSVFIKVVAGATVSTDGAGLGVNFRYTITAG